MRAYNTSNILTERFKYILFSTGLCFLSIISYLLYLQIYKTQDFFNKSKSNYTRVIKLVPVRGEIIDKNGIKLATNRPVYSLSWYGTGNKQLSSTQLELIKKIKQYLELEPQIESQIQAAEKNFRILKLRQEVSIEVVKRLLEHHPNEPNMLITQTFKRLYPYHTYASHVIGYVSNSLDNIIGKTGIEYYCQDVLQGQPGQVIKTINSFGKLINLTTAKNPLAGRSVQTTLNIKKQTLAEELFPANLSGSLIILNPENGAIEVMLSRPGFNANVFLNTLTLEHWQELQAKKCLLNRACFSAYPPASVFKLVSLVAALEEDIITTDALWNCKGKLFFGNRYNYCGLRSGHGEINTQEALAYSCNIPFYEIAQKMPINTLAKYARSLGLGLKTGILLGENPGLIPTSEWKKNTLGEQWWPGESLSAAIGQSFLLTTPIQIAQMFGAICTGSLTKPRLLTSEPIIKNPITISSQTLKFLKKSMKCVAQKGTARILNKLEDYKIYAKTGTAQTASRRHSYKTRPKPHVWFAAAFRYKDEPLKVIVLLLENANSVRNALKVILQFFENYGAYKDSKSHRKPTI